MIKTNSLKQNKDTHIMEILGYYNGAEIMIHSENGIVDDVYIWNEDKECFDTKDIIFRNSLNSLFVHIDNYLEFLKQISKRLYIPYSEYDIDDKEYNKQVDMLINAISEL